MNLMDTVFANTNFADEAENYKFYGITDFDEILDDVRENLKEYDATEEECREYAAKIYDAVQG